MIVREAECVWATLAKVNRTCPSGLNSSLSFFVIYIQSQYNMTIVMKTILLLSVYIKELSNHDLLAYI